MNADADAAAGQAALAAGKTAVGSAAQSDDAPEVDDDDSEASRHCFDRGPPPVGSTMPVTHSGLSSGPPQALVS